MVDAGNMHNLLGNNCRCLNVCILSRNGVFSVEKDLSRYFSNLYGPFETEQNRSKLLSFMAPITRFCSEGYKYWQTVEIECTEITNACTWLVIFGLVSC